MITINDKETQQLAGESLGDRVKQAQIQQEIERSTQKLNQSIHRRCREQVRITAFGDLAFRRARGEAN